MNEVLLLSGGIDSVALAYQRRPAFALTVDYGQRPAEKEIAVSQYVAGELGISHRVIRLDLATVGGGLLAGMEPLSNAPTPEWWPFRNQLLVTVGAMMAVKEGLAAVVIGTVVSDGDHADGTSRFLDYCRDLLSCQEGQILLHAPAQLLASVELVKQSGIPFHLLASAHSCHRGITACGQCRGCQKHEAIFEAIGLL
jgi:7-cyano-7-deazaguanine synthase